MSKNTTGASDNPGGKNSRTRMHEHSGSMGDIIDLLQGEMTAKSIMTPWFRVVTQSGNPATNETKDHAKSVMEENQYSAIPVMAANHVIGVFTRHAPCGSPCFARIRSNDFIKPDLGLIELIRYLRDNQKIVVGVGSADAPVGWITYADLSKRPFRVLFFVILAEIEYLLAESLDRAYPADSWKEFLSEGGNKDDLEGLIERQKDAASWDVLMPLTTFAEIGHLIGAVGKSPKALALLGEENNINNKMKSICDVRNRVAHVVRPIVAGPGQIKSVANQMDLFLGWAEKWSANLARASAGGANG